MDSANNNEVKLFVNRKLGEEIKENLMVIDGELQLRDGSSPKEYLESWMKFHQLDSGVPVCVCTVKTLKWLEEQALLSQWRAA